MKNKLFWITSTAIFAILLILSAVFGAFEPNDANRVTKIDSKTFTVNVYGRAESITLSDIEYTYDSFTATVSGSLLLGSGADFYAEEIHSQRIDFDSLTDGECGSWIKTVNGTMCYLTIKRESIGKITDGYLTRDGYGDVSCLYCDSCSQITYTEKDNNMFYSTEDSKFTGIIIADEDCIPNQENGSRLYAEERIKTDSDAETSGYSIPTFVLLSWKEE